MKKVITITMALISFISAFSEEILEDSISSPGTDATKRVYCMLLGINKNLLGLGNKVSVEVDFGEEQSKWGNDGRDLLIDENGKEIKFNGMIDAMNYMAARGWEFENSYAITIGNQLVYHWLMSKEIPFDGTGKEEITQRRDKKKKKAKKETKFKYDDPLYN